MFQAFQPLVELSLYLGVIVAQFLVEVLSVWRRGHGSAEERLNNERVMWLQSVAIGVTKGVGQLFGRVGNVVAERLGSEVEAAVRQRC